MDDELTVVDPAEIEARSRDGDYCSPAKKSSWHSTAGAVACSVPPKGALFTWVSDSARTRRPDPGRRATIASRSAASRRMNAG